MAELPTLASAQAELCKRSFYEFVRRAWHVLKPSEEFTDNWHIQVVCEHLESVYKGETRDLLINMPPGTMKTMLVCVLWPVWVWIQDPSFAFMFGSYDASLTHKSAAQSLELIRSEWFQARWGSRVLLKKASPAIGEYETTAGGYRFATSVGGKATGRHANCVVFDDPLKAQDCTAARLEDADTWWHQAMSGRMRDPKTHRRVGIMQRLHDQDLSGICEREGYKVLRLTMRYEPGWSWEGDPRTEPGELLWPARYPESVVLAKEKDMGSRGTAAQYQQRPAPEGGLIFKRPWFRYWREPLDPAPPEGQVRMALPDRFDAQWQSWDMAFKGADTSDFVCCQVWARRGADFFLLYQLKERLDFPATVAAVRAVSRKWPRAITKLVEDKANGAAVVATLKKEISGFFPVNPEGGKEARANAVAPLHEAGNVWYPPPERYPWVDDHVETMAQFPTLANDDDVDAETQALTWGYKRKSSWSAAMENVINGTTDFR